MRLIECTRPEQVRMAQRLRYEVYCLEKGWVDADQCMGGLETDEYDADAVHFLVTENDGTTLLGTSRLLLGSKVELPASRFLDVAPLGLRPEECVEVSRMAARKSSRAQNLSVFLGMTQAMWEWCMERDLKAWMSVADVSVFLLMRRVGMPILASGERVDYLGSACIPSCVDMPKTGDVLEARGFDARVA